MPEPEIEAVMAARWEVSEIDPVDLEDLRARVRAEFTGTTTCTHLNDQLRSLAGVRLVDSFDQPLRHKGPRQAVIDQDGLGMDHPRPEHQDRSARRASGPTVPAVSQGGQGSSPPAGSSSDERQLTRVFR